MVPLPGSAPLPCNGGTLPASEPEFRPALPKAASSNATSGRSEGRRPSLHGCAAAALLAEDIAETEDLAEKSPRSIEEGSKPPPPIPESP